jgi:hypothetical protein
MKYTGNINSYSFTMKESDDVIEVWSDMDSEFPESYIYLKEGTVQNKKDFDYEIMAWWVRNKK